MVGSRFRAVVVFVEAEVVTLPHLSAEETTLVEFQMEWLTIGGWKSAEYPL